MNSFIRSEIKRFVADLDIQTRLTLYSDWLLVDFSFFGLGANLIDLCQADVASARVSSHNGASNHYRHIRNIVLRYNINTLTY